jgi:indole-3-glycerol phosphate synthase/phosphoribosylanthranilate isomerase
MAEGVLGEIVARKRRDVAERLAGTKIDALRSQAPRGPRSLRAALARPGARFIMEVKKASPSEGAFRAGADPAAMALAYKGAADAVSVLTDTPYFGGSLEDLRAVRAVFDGPILAKDFVVDPRQVPEARLNGADAVLVMMSVLDDQEAAAILAEAARLGMDALAEAHDEAELRRAVALGATLIGINNRDLRTLEVDIATTERLAALVPPDRLLVTESGIRSRADVERLSPHADAFLVGTALMRSEAPARMARELAFGRVKVCGLTDSHDTGLATELGAAYAGLVMVPNTPRAVTDTEARAIVDANGATRFVGVFRNEKLMQLALTARTLGLAAVQLHGEEDAGYLRALRRLLPDECEIWAAGPVGSEPPEPRAGADRMLYDTQAKGGSGGTGRAFDWSLLGPVAGLDTALLAGGLNPANARAAARVGAYALDVGSGVEMAPGRKDAGKLAAFFEALRPAARSDARC